MNLKLKKDARYVILEDIWENGENYPLVAISPMDEQSCPENYKTDSLFMFYMFGEPTPISIQKYDQSSDKNTLIIDGVDII